MPDLIRRYNEATGVANTDTSGYHHTITVFLLREIWAVMRRAPEASLDGHTARVLASPLGDRDFVLTRYRRETLFSVAARWGWVEPDLACDARSASQSAREAPHTLRTHIDRSGV